MKDYYHYDDRDKSLAACFGALFSALLSILGSALIYIFLIHDKKNNIADEVLLWIGCSVFMLVGIYLFIYSVSIGLQNLVLFKKRLPLPKSKNAVFINTDPQAGIVALIICFVFILSITFFLYPIVMAIILATYALFILIYNLFKRYTK